MSSAGRRPGVSSRDRKRVKTQADASALLGISPQRLQEMRRLAPWWVAELSNEEGWDVVGIAIAQTQYHEDRNADDDVSLRTKAAELQKVEEEAGIKKLDRIRKERVEAEEDGSLVRADVVKSLLSEALSELRRLIDDVPYVMSQQVPPEVLPFVYVNDTLVSEVSKLAPLQRCLLKVTETFQRWLDRVPEEVFDIGQDDAA